jgi:hypothetical protein
VKGGKDKMAESMPTGGGDNSTTAEEDAKTTEADLVPESDDDKKTAEELKEKANEYFKSKLVMMTSSRNINATVPTPALGHVFSCFLLQNVQKRTCNEAYVFAHLPSLLYTFASF